MNDRGQPENRIEQVRELMFGPQLRECVGRIEQLESLVTRSLEETQRRMGEARSLAAQELGDSAAGSDKKLRTLDTKLSEELATLRTRIDEMEERYNARLRALEERLTASVEAIEKRVQTLGTELETQTSDLRRQGRRTDERLDSRVQSLTDEIESGASRLRGELTQAQKGIQENVSAVESHLSNELRRHLNDVRFTKVSKDEISDILVEFGMRLKGLNSATARLVSVDPPSSE